MQLSDLAHTVARARRVLFITGAGVSADSGLPVYRGVGGLYDDGETVEGLRIEQALSGAMFRARPALTWRYILQIEAACRGAAPNRAHEVIAALQDRMEVVVLTQNVDALHTDAGSRNVIEMHGNLRHLSCTQCDWTDTVRDYAHLDALPTCPRCGGVIRPDVVLFDEMLPTPAIAAYEAELAKPFDIVFAVGTSAGFPYIRGPFEAASYQGVLTVEVNPGDTDISWAATARVRQGAADAMDALWRAL
jgi:NAD-dependent deacetylase